MQYPKRFTETDIPLAEVPPSLANNPYLEHPVSCVPCKENAWEPGRM